MNRKIFTKLTCLALCLVTIFCSGGGYKPIGCSCLDAIFEADWQRDKDEIIAVMQAKKDEAETYIPQCTDYTLKILPEEYFKTDEERQAQGFMKYDVFFRYHLDLQYEFLNWSTGIAVGEKRNINGDWESKILYQMSYYSVDEIYARKIFNYFKDHAILFDGKFFAVTSVDKEGGGNNTFQAPALYLLDFENDQILYCGCALEFYDFHKNGLYDRYIYEVMGSSGFDYKIVKNTVGSENEEIK